MTPSAPPDDAVARFAGDVRQLLNGDSPGRLGVAVSGGPDSLALLLLAHAAFPDQIEAATVDHGLRDGSDREAHFVARLCATLDVPHAIFTLDPTTRDRGNLSDWARTERYKALDQWAEARGLTHLLTAHHGDDQLETMLMRLNRGSGVAGLAGIRARRGRLLRTLLGWRKAELEEIVQQCGIEAVDDPSNRNDRYDRARLRRDLAGVTWLDAAAAARSAAALAQAEAALDWAAHHWAEQRLITEGDTATLDIQGLPAELVRRLVLAAMQCIRGDANPRGEDLDRLIARLQRGEAATLAGVKARGGGLWRFSAAPPHRTRP